MHRNYDMINLCCIKLLNLWEFVMQTYKTNVPTEMAKMSQGIPTMAKS